jgi:hypothetical protein
VIKVRALTWTLPVAVALIAVMLGFTAVRAGSPREALARLVIPVVLACVVAAFVVPSHLRRALVARGFPEAFVRNVRKTSSLVRTLGVAVPRRATLAVTRDSVRIFGGIVRPRELWREQWANIRTLEIGSDRDWYLAVETLDLIFRDGRRLALPIEQGLEPLTGQRLWDAAERIARMSGVRVDVGTGLPPHDQL